MSERGTTVATLTALFALADKTWIDEVAAVMKKHAGHALQQKPKVVAVESPDLSTLHAEQRAIMGTNFLGEAEIAKAYSVKWTKAQLEKLSVIPFSEETLRDCKDTHVLFAGFPLSINDIRAKASGNNIK